MKGTQLKGETDSLGAGGAIERNRTCPQNPGQNKQQNPDLVKGPRLPLRFGGEGPTPAMERVMYFCTVPHRTAGRLGGV